MGRISKSQVDRLGERLRDGSSSDADLTMLDDYRREFWHAFSVVIERTHELAGVEPSGRMKTTQSIVEKLRREHARLSQIQDVAGCRIVVPTTLEQDHAVGALLVEFPEARCIDRRQKSSHGYRAVHVIVPCDGLHVEVQVRTAIQQYWAELCERMADDLDLALKYGGGPESLAALLASSSGATQELEAALARYSALRRENDRLTAELDEVQRQLHAGSIRSEDAQQFLDDRGKQSAKLASARREVDEDVQARVQVARGILEQAMSEYRRLKELR